MADFCKQCSIENWGKDMKDLARSRFKKGDKFAVICEGCGWTVVDGHGVCQHLGCHVKVGERCQNA